MSLRKPSSFHSTSPLKKDMDAFKATYGLDDKTDGVLNQNYNNIAVSSSRDEVAVASDDDYDALKKQKRPSPSSGGILGRIKVPSISPSGSHEHTAIPTSSVHPVPLPFSSLHQEQQLQHVFADPYTAPRDFPQRSFSSSSDHHFSDDNVFHQSSSLPPPFVMQVTAIASLGGVLFGYDMGVIAGALPQLQQTFDLSESQQELVVSILYIGGGLGAAIGGSLCDLLGRKPAILWTDITFMVGASVLFTAPHVGAVCIGRIIVGFAVAVSGIADVSYLHEIAPKEWRGAIVSVNEACISLGFLFAFIVGEIFTPLPSSNNDNGDADVPPPRGWRYMFGLAGVMALIQFLGMWTMPESPVWLKEQGRHEESKAALRRINGGNIVTDVSEGMDHAEEEDDCNDFKEEINGSHPHESPNNSHQEAAVESKASYESLSHPPGMISPGSNNRGPVGNMRFQFLELRQKVQRGWRKLKGVIGMYRRQVWIAMFLSVTQQLCGQTSVLNYAPTILRAVVKQDNADGDGNDEVSGGATLSIGLVKFIATVLVIWKVESVGRRTLLIVGMGTIAFGLLLVAVAFSANNPYIRDKEDDNNTGTVQRGSGFYFALPGVLLVVSGYSMSFGPLTWLLTSELFPTGIRGRALGASTIVTYMCAAMVTYSFLTAQSILGTSTVFLIYMLITLAGMVFACMAIPDTGNKTLDEIEADLSNMPWWRRFGSRDGLGDSNDGNKRWRRHKGSSSASRNGSATDGMMEDVAPPLPTMMLRPNGGIGRLVEGEIT